MTEESASISAKKVRSAVGKYIWDSPCLKRVFYNPFLLGMLIVLLICLMDYIYGKRFDHCTNTKIAEHIITSYVVVMSCVLMNYLLVKYSYRLKYTELKKTNSVEDDDVPDSSNGPILATYI